MAAHHRATIDLGDLYRDAVITRAAQQASEITGGPLDAAAILDRAAESATETIAWLSVIAVLLGDVLARQEIQTAVAALVSHAAQCSCAADMKAAEHT